MMKMKMTLTFQFGCRMVPLQDVPHLFFLNWQIGWKVLSKHKQEWQSTLDLEIDPTNTKGL